MKNIIIKFLSTRNRFMPEMHLRQPGFMHSACGLFKGKKKQKVIKNSRLLVIQNMTDINKDWHQLSTNYLKVVDSSTHT